MATYKTIWKYELEVTDRQEFEMPRQAKFLTVQFQRKTLCLWAAVNPDQKTETRRIAIVGTGNPMPNQWVDYIGTVQHHDGQLVWHIFEV